jgi:hypothetical protein
LAVRNRQPQSETPAPEPSLLGVPAEGSIQEAVNHQIDQVRVDLVTTETEVIRDALQVFDYVSDLIKREANGPLGRAHIIQVDIRSAS